jgi:hypothetical protein
MTASGIAIPFPKSHQSEVGQRMSQESAAPRTGLAMSANSVVHFVRVNGMTKFAL